MMDRSFREIAVFFRRGQPFDLHEYDVLEDLNAEGSAFVQTPPNSVGLFFEGLNADVKN